MQGGRDHILGMQSQVLNLIGDADDVAANLTRNIDHSSWPAVTRNQRATVGCSFANSGDLAQPHRALRIVADNCVSDVLDAFELRIRQH